MVKPRVDVIQLTPRRSFDVAKAFDEKSQLNLLCSDFAFQNNTFVKYLFPKRVSVQRYAFAPKHGRLVVDYITGLRFRRKLRRLPAHKKFIAQLDAANSLANFYLRRRNSVQTKAEVVYGLDCAALQVFKCSAGQVKVLEQCVAPRITQLAALEKYGKPQDIELWAEHFQTMAGVEREEWELADVILSPSEFVTRALTELGVIASKIKQLPYWTPFEPLAFLPSKDSTCVRILFVGNEAKRKGLHDFFATASMLSGLANIEFLVAGAVRQEFSELVGSVGDAKLTFLGQLTHDELKKQFLATDIFFLPSYLEGSSVATYEAMSFGLPVVTTHQAGSVVEDGISGYLHEAGDLTGFARSIKLLIQSEKLREQMGANALRKIASFQFKNYSTALVDIISESI